MSIRILTEAAWQNEVDQATAVANAMKAEGWEFASHTWGHIDPRKVGIDGVMKDTQRWLDNVATVVGSTDVIIFAFGADIGDWQPYTSDNPYFTYLKEKGFNIFCNVDSSKCWVQFGSNFGARLGPPEPRWLPHVLQPGAGQRSLRCELRLG